MGTLEVLDMNKFIASAALAAGFAFAYTPASAAITGDVTGGGTFNDTVTSPDGWSNEIASAVDFWTLTAAGGTLLSVDVTSADGIDFGVSVYEGVVGDGFLISFDNDGDTGGGIYVGGNQPFAFGDRNGFSDLALTGGGTYTIAVGGAGFSPVFGGNYEMTVSAVPVPAALPLIGSALLGLGAVGRRRH